MKRARDTFRFSPEPGTRLRGLRKRTGLTQRELALLMGRIPSRYQPQIARIERARTGFPTLAFVADRWCAKGLDREVLPAIAEEVFGVGV